MPCYHPLIRAVDSRGNQYFEKKTDKPFVSSIYEEQNTVPCRQCYGCRVRKTLDWALRCSHELQAHNGKGAFLTLTYDNENMPEGCTILPASKRSAEKLGLDCHLEPFHDSLRKKLRTRGFPSYKYFQCGEYGDKTNRPHYHVLIFGFDFPDKELWQESKGNKYYRSKLLESTWRYGNSIIGELNFNTAAYTAKYCQKKITGDMADDHYTRVDSETGEFFKVLPEFHTQSNKPKGIGHAWLKEYLTDVFPKDEVVHQGKQYPVPRYYYDELEKLNPDMYEQVQHQRNDARLYKDTYIEIERLAAMEKAKIAQMEKHLLDSEIKI